MIAETTFSYSAQGTAYDAVHLQCPGARARILLMPDWEGMNSRWAREIARRYAATCNAELILTDHYGAACPHPSFERAAQINQGHYDDPLATRALFRAMVDALGERWNAGGPLLVVGFCSGGTFAFETGRSGAPVDAVYSVHGGPTTIAPLREAGNYPIFTMVHGGADPIIPPTTLQEFSTEMHESRTRWAMHVISDAKHSFTRFDSTRQNYGVGYSKRAEIEARHLVLAGMSSLLEMQEQ